MTRHLLLGLLLLLDFEDLLLLLSVMLVRITLLCLLARAMGHPVLHAGLSPIRRGNSYTVTSSKDTRRSKEDVEEGAVEVLVVETEEEPGMVTIFLWSS